MIRDLLARVRSFPLERWSLRLLALFLAFSVLWKGGKSIDTTWILMGVTWLVIIADALRPPLERADRPVSRTLWLTALMIMVWSVLSFLLSSTRNYGLDEVLRTVCLTLLFLWAVRRGGERAIRVNVLRSIAIAALIACLLGVGIYILQPVNRFVGSFFDFRFHTDYWPNAWGEFLLLSWPIVLLWAKRGVTGLGTPFRRTAVFLLRYSAVGFLLGCLLLSYSRASFIAFVLQIGLLAVLMLSRSDRSVSKRDMFSRAVMIGGIAFLVFTGVNAMRSRQFAVQSLEDKAFFQADEGVTSITERLQFWGQSFSLAAERPLFGWGPYSFRFVQPRLQNEVLATSDHPHNVFLKLAMEQGWPAAGLFFLLLLLVLFPYASALFARWRASFVLERLPWLRFFIPLTNPSFGFQDIPEEHLFLMTAVAGVLAHNLVDFNLQFVGIALPLWLILGLMTRPQGQTMEAASHTVTRTAFVRTLEVTVISVVLCLGFSEGVFLVTSSVGRRAEAHGDAQTALRWYDRSRPEIFARDLLLSRALTLIALERLPEARASVEGYLRANGEDARAWRVKGQIALLEGDPETAVLAYTEAFRRGRYNELATIRGLVDATAKAGKESALDEFRSEIDRVLAAFTRAIAVNAHFVTLGENADQFIAVCDALSARYPSDAPRYEVMAARADNSIKRERSKVVARPAGFLW